MDRELLKPLNPIVLKKKDSNKKVFIGYVDEIHGKGSEAFDIEVSRKELHLIAQYYCNLINGIEKFWEMGYSGSWEMRMFPYSNMRLHYLSAFIEKELIQQLLEEKIKIHITKDFCNDQEKIRITLTRKEIDLLIKEYSELKRNPNFFQPRIDILIQIIN